MRLAIHHFPGGFSEQWIRYCKINNVDYKLVDCTATDIIGQIEDCDGLMWHWSQLDSKAKLLAKPLISSLEKKGLKVYPNSTTCWHFDDKIGQKYLLESLKAQLVPAYVFYEKRKAKEWVRNASFPVVFKLRAGAGSNNVKLVSNASQANRLIRKAFGHGFRPVSRVNLLSDKFTKFKRKKNLSNLMIVLKELVRFVYPRYDDKMLPREKGYVYFQDFIPDNKFDIRVVIIGGRAFGIKRFVRRNDFRASGSGNFISDKEAIPVECISYSFKLAEQLEMQSVCFDFVFKGDNFFLLEISYGSDPAVYLDCPGFWDKDLNWHPGKFTPEWFIIEDLINSILT